MIKKILLFLLMLFAWKSFASEDFAIYHGEAMMSSGSTTVSITNGVHYNLETGTTWQNSFCYLVNSRLTGGNSRFNTVDINDFTTWINNNTNIATSITFERFDNAGSNYVSWAILEYVGDVGGANELVIKDSTFVTNASGMAVTTGSVVSVEDDTDIVVFITGQAGDQNNPNGMDRTQHIAEWSAGNNWPIFTRGDPLNNIRVSYSILEFTGINWKVQRETRTLNSADIGTNTLSTPVASTNRAFMHVQVNCNDDECDEQGVNTWFSATDKITFERQASASAIQNIAAWIVENTDTSSDGMYVWPYKGTLTVAGQPSYETNAITAIDSITNVSIMGQCSINANTGQNTPAGCVNFQLLSTTQIQTRRPIDLGDDIWVLSVVDFPKSTDKQPIPKTTTIPKLGI